MSQAIWDKLFRKSAEHLAQSTSRRSFLVRTTVSLGLFASAGFLLPSRRVAAQVVQPCTSGNCCKANGKSNDPKALNYWAYAGINGKPCALGCCGATTRGCPATVKDKDNKTLPVVLAGCWVAAVPDCDGKMQCVSYQDCCTNTGVAFEHPCEKQAPCQRIGGQGLSWCSAGRMDNKTPSRQICPTAPGVNYWATSMASWHAVCTHAFPIRAADPGESDCAGDHIPGPG